MAFSGDEDKWRWRSANACCLSVPACRITANLANLVGCQQQQQQQQPNRQQQSRNNNYKNNNNNIN